jgi:hypothetical protein
MPPGRASASQAQQSTPEGMPHLPIGVCHRPSQARDGCEDLFGTPHSSYHHAVMIPTCRGTSAVTPWRWLTKHRVHNLLIKLLVMHAKAQEGGKGERMWGGQRFVGDSSRGCSCTLVVHSYRERPVSQGPRGGY